MCPPPGKKRRRNSEEEHYATPQDEDLYGLDNTPEEPHRPQQDVPVLEWKLPATKKLERTPAVSLQSSDGPAATKEDGHQPGRAQSPASPSDIDKHQFRPKIANFSREQLENLWLRTLYRSFERNCVISDRSRRDVELYMTKKEQTKEHKEAVMNMEKKEEEYKRKMMEVETRVKVSEEKEHKSKKKTTELETIFEILEIGMEKDEA